VGASLGAGAAAGAAGFSDPRLILGGAAVGAAAGVLAHLATHKEGAMLPSAMVEELKTGREA
jgi:hypothetical protein